MANAEVRYEEGAVHFLDTYFKTLEDNVYKELTEQAIKSGTMRVTANMAMKCAEKISLNAIDEKNQS